MERKQSNLHDYAPTIEKKKKLLSFAKQIEQIYPYWQNYQTAKKASIEKRTAYQTAATNIWTSTIVSKATGRTARECFEQKEQMVQLEKILPDLERSIQALKRIDALNIQQKEIQEIIEKKDTEQSQIQLQITQIEERMQKGFYICNPSTQNISDYPNTKNNCLSYKHMNRISYMVSNQNRT